MPRAPTRDIAEIFGHAPDDLTTAARSLWTLAACPFLQGPCTKTNHDQSITYGVCSVANHDGQEVIICPNRLYAGNYDCLRRVSREMFGEGVPFRLYHEYVAGRHLPGPAVVALGQNSGREIGLGKLKIDWVLALIDKAKLLDFVGVAAPKSL